MKGEDLTCRHVTSLLTEEDKRLKANIGGRSQKNGEATGYVAKNSHGHNGQYLQSDNKRCYNCNMKGQFARNFCLKKSKQREQILMSRRKRDKKVN